MSNTNINTLKKVFKYFQIQMYLTPCLLDTLFKQDLLYFGISYLDYLSTWLEKQVVPVCEKCSLSGFVLKSSLRRNVAEFSLKKIVSLPVHTDRSIWPSGSQTQNLMSSE